MFFKPDLSRRVLLIAVFFGLLGVAFIPPVLALDPPAISVNPIWRPAVQLSTIDTVTPGVTDAGDDLRYVDADVYVTTSVQFWTADVSCTVDKNTLETYTPNQDSGLNPSPDDLGPVIYGAEWTANGATFLQIVTNTINTNGKISFAATRAGTSSPMGNNGTKTTFLLATLRYRVKVLASNKTSPLTCTAAFLDKNGKVVLPPSITAPAPLSVITGYTINGKVTYQDQTAHTGIVAKCVDGLGADHFSNSPVTAAGSFSITTRDLGTHDCYFYGSKINTDTTSEDVHLTARTSFRLNSAIYNLLPITLRDGNVNRDGSLTIDFNDISVVTANWNTTAATPYTNGDANGDKKTDRADLALVAGNYGLSDPSNASHLIYSLPRNSERFMNSRIWIGGYYGDASVSQLVAGTNRSYWPTLSPDGSKIAFVNNVAAGTADKFALFVAPVNAGVIGAAVNITPSAAFDAFAPSWSPDGTTLAFACAYSRADWTAGKGRGNLCFVNPNGKNLRQKIALPASNQMINIHPVAWFNNTSLMYGSPDWTNLLTALPACNNRICRLDLVTMNNTAEANIALADSDMPTIRQGSMGSVLFYRQSLGVNNDVIRYAELNDSLTTPAVVAVYNCANGAGSKHCDVATGAGFNQVGYFNAYTGNNDSDQNQYALVFYNQDEATASGGGIIFSLMDWVGTPASHNWVKNYASYSVSNGVGNPAITAPNTPSSPNPEGFLALRNTVEWVP